jgi:WD40 repeat protein
VSNKDDNDDNKESLVPAQPAALSRAGAASLATRGLHELSQRGITWRHAHVNLEDWMGLDPLALAISSRGLVASNRRSGSESIHAIAILDVTTGEQVTIKSPAFDLSGRPDAMLLGNSCIVENVAEGFSWSPCGRYLLTRSREYSRPVRLYDGCKKEFLGVIGHEPDCNSITWSPDGKWLATGASCCDWPPLAIWHIEQIETCSLEKRVELDIGEWFSGTSWFFSRDEYRGASFNLFDGFYAAAFNSHSTVVALSAINRLEFPREVAPRDEDQEESTGEEVDRLSVYSVVGFDVPSLHQKFRTEVPAYVESLAWSQQGRLVICSSSQVAVVEPNSSKLLALPFQGDICLCHPNHEWCAFASRRWPWDVVNGDDRLVIADLTDFNEISEQRITGGIYDMAWSSDGHALLAISSKGEFWECDFGAF